MEESEMGVRRRHKSWNASGIAWGQASGLTDNVGCTELSWHPNKDSDSNQALNTTRQLWLTNSTHHLAHCNRKLNPISAKTQELSPPRRQSCRWMHQTTQLASASLPSVALPPRQPGGALAFPSAMGKSSGECGRKTGSPWSPPIDGKGFFTSLAGRPGCHGLVAAVRLPAVSVALLASFYHHLYLPYSSRAFPGYTGDRTLGSGGMAEGQVIHLFIE